MNKVTISGTLVREAEYRELNDFRVARFTLLVQRESGEGKDYISFKTYNLQADRIKNKKVGDFVEVEGETQINNYERKDGTKVYQQIVFALEIK